MANPIMDYEELKLVLAHQYAKLDDVTRSCVEEITRISEQNARLNTIIQNTHEQFAKEIEHLRVERDLLLSQLRKDQALVSRLCNENEELRIALRLVADEPNIDKARTIADAILLARRE
jgi:uncharacterized membrane protein YccC